MASDLSQSTIVLDGSSSSASCDLSDPGTDEATSESTDEKYLRLTREHGLSLMSDAQLLELGHNVCATLDTGASVREVISGLLDSGVATADEAGGLVGTAVGAYCPQYTSDLNAG